jgi:transposase, IS30 family
MTPMAERPAEIATRTVPGHWEGDLIKGARNGSAVGTLVERTTRLVLLARMDGTDEARSAREGFTKKLRHVPALLRKTLTYDRGKEMAEHERLDERLATQIFFADPYSPWQRGGRYAQAGFCGGHQQLALLYLTIRVPLPTLDHRRGHWT